MGILIFWCSYKEFVGYFIVNICVISVFVGIMSEVVPVTPAEEKLYESIDFDPEDYRKDIGTKKLVHHNDKVRKNS